LHQFNLSYVGPTLYITFFVCVCVFGGGGLSLTWTMIYVYFHWVRVTKFLAINGDN
jgi:hypothetical protein